MNHPLFRRRVGTGGLYAPNRKRRPRVRRAVRRSAAVRVDNRTRPWAQSEPSGLSAVNERQLRKLLHTWQTTITQILDAIEAVGETLQRHRRLRTPLPAAWLREHPDAVDWFLVLHTVGLVDRRGVWLAEPLW